MVLQRQVSFGSGYGLLPDGTKPQPEPTLTCDPWHIVMNIFMKFHLLGSRNDSFDT